jgi:hypothetical protein
MTSPKGSIWVFFADRRQFLMRPHQELSRMVCSPLANPATCDKWMTRTCDNFWCGRTTKLVMSIGLPVPLRHIRRSDPGQTRPSVRFPRAIAAQDGNVRPMNSHGHRFGGWLRQVAVCLVVCLSVRAAGRVRSLEEYAAGEVRAAAAALERRDADERLTGVLDLALLAGEVLEPGSFGLAIGALIESVDDEDTEVRRWAAAALDGFRWRQDLPGWAGAQLNRRLREGLDHRRPRIRLLASRIVLELDPLDARASAAYGDLLDHKDRHVRGLARELVVSLASAGALSPGGEIARRLRDRMDSRDGEWRFDAALAFWILAQTVRDEGALAQAEKVLTSDLVRVRGADKRTLLDRLLANLQLQPTLPPGPVLVEALRRSVEEEPPEIALAAGAVLALLDTPGSGLLLSVSLRRTLPGYLRHASAEVRWEAAQVIGNHPATRLLSSPMSAAEDGTPFLALPFGGPTLRIEPPLRQGLTNLFGLPSSAVQLRALGRVAVDASFVAEHAEGYSEVLTQGLASGDREVLRQALSADMLGVYNRIEAASARELLLRRLVDLDGAEVELAMDLCLEPSMTNLPAGELARVVVELAGRDSVAARRAAGGAWLRWAQLQGTNNPIILPRLGSVPRRLEVLAGDPHPSVAWFGVAGLISGAMNPDLGSLATSCRRRLENLLEAADPSVRCRFLAMVRGVRPLTIAGFAQVRAWHPRLDRSPETKAWVRGLLDGLLRENDPLMREQVLRVFRALGLEPPQSKADA